MCEEASSEVPVLAIVANLLARLVRADGRAFATDLLLLILLYKCSCMHFNGTLIYIHISCIWQIPLTRATYRSALKSLSISTSSNWFTRSGTKRTISLKMLLGRLVLYENTQDHTRINEEVGF